MACSLLAYQLEAFSLGFLCLCCLRFSLSRHIKSEFGNSFSVQHLIHIRELQHLGGLIDLNRAPFYVCVSHSFSYSNQKIRVLGSLLEIDAVAQTACVYKWFLGFDCLAACCDSLKFLKEVRRPFSFCSVSNSHHHLRQALES